MKKLDCKASVVGTGYISLRLPTDIMMRFLLRLRAIPIKTYKAGITYLSGVRGCTPGNILEILSARGVIWGHFQLLTVA